MESQKASGSWAFLVFLLFTIGVPAGVGVSLRDQALEHPFLALGLFLLYEFFVILSSLATEVGQNLRKLWGRRIASWLDQRAQWLFSGYYRSYCKKIAYQHRDLDVRGLSTHGVSLPLNQVFVELSLEPQEARRASTDPLRVPEQLRAGRHCVWDYLTFGSIEGKRLIILGAPGSGKTTLLKHMALVLTMGAKPGRHASVPHKLPILLFLRDYAQKISQNPDFSLVDALQVETEKWKPPEPPGWFQRQLEQGECLVMLDGLDEVADSTLRQRVVAWVQKQMEAYEKNPFLVTSRPTGYRNNPLRGMTVLEVRPFTDVQVRRFVHNWYLAQQIHSELRNDPGVQRNAKVGAEDLLQRLHNNPSLLALSVNPLLLTMMATVHKFRNKLPGGRVELYEEICEVFLGSRQEAKGLTLDLDAAKKQSVLQALAYHMMCTRQREIQLGEARTAITEPLAHVSIQLSAETFLAAIQNSSTSLLLERESGVYSFAHLTFQEYLAALYIREEQLGQELLTKVHDEWWHETIRLYCAQANATSIIEACLAGERPSALSLTLAIECLEEARKVEPTLRTRLQSILAQWVDDEDPERRRIVAEALLNLRLHQMVPIDESRSRDRSLLTCAEYQVFLDACRERGQHLQPDYWLEYQFPQGQGRMPILGVRAADVIAFCQWLTERTAGEWVYRLPETGLDAEMMGQKFSDELSAGAGYWVGFDGQYQCVRSETAEPVFSSTMLEQRFARDLLLADEREVQIRSHLEQIHPFVLNRDFASLKALDLTRDLKFGLVNKPDRVRVLATDLQLDLALILNRALQSNLSQALDRTRVVNLAQSLARVRSLDPDFSLIRGSILAHRSNWSAAAEFLRWYIRLCALVIIADLQSQPNTQATLQTIDDYLDIYVDLALLEERIQGTISPFEGILIVKEQKKSER